MKRLPYRASTATGDSFDIDFPLHPDTVNAVRISQLISDLLASVDRSLAIGGETCNGDVLQAVAMAMAIRARMVNAPVETTADLALDLLTAALTATAEAPRQSPRVGHA